MLYSTSMNKISTAFGILLISLLSPAMAAPVTIKHYSGETTVNAPAQRVIALGPHALDLLLSLGIQPVGYGEAAQLGVTNYGSPIKQIRYLGSRITGNPVNVGDRYKPNLEVVASLKPDLIVGENYAQDSYSALNNVAPTLLFEGIHTGDWQKTLPILAKAVGKEAKAAQVIERHNRIINEAKKQLPEWIKGKTALVVYNSGGADKDVYTILGPQDWTGGYFQNLGFKLDLLGAKDTSMSEGYKKISSEALTASQADAIFVIASKKNTVTQAKKDWEQNAIAQRLKATKDGHVYFLDVHLLSRIRGPIAEELIARELARQIK